MLHILLRKSQGGSNNVWGRNYEFQIKGVVDFVFVQGGDKLMPGSSLHYIRGSALLLCSAYDGISESKQCENTGSLYSKAFI